jgi:NAD(P)-dependent dehydrogenase (short-subunit alcohol dehydrogenase family)
LDRTPLACLPPISSAASPSLRAQLQIYLPQVLLSQMLLRLPQSTVYNADVTDPTNLTIALEKAVAEVGTPEVVVYNAARIQYGMFGDYKEEDILEDFKVPSLGLYTSAKVLLPRLQTLAKEKPEAHPCLFVTSSPIIHQPFAPVFSLSMAKAAQASLVKLLAEQAKDFVHVAMVTAWGPVALDEPVNNPGNIATRFWDLWEQEKGKWEFGIEVK